MFSFTIDKNDWSRGVSVTTKHNNGGYSPVRQGMNLAKAQGGILYPQPARTDLDADNSNVMEDSVVAFTADPSFLGNDGYALDQDGNFYTIDGTTVTKRQTDAVNSYNEGTVDMRVFGNSLFATSATDIAKLDGSDLTSIDHDWWTVTEGNGGLTSVYRHHMEVVEDALFIADANVLHVIQIVSAAFQTTEDVMTLPEDININTMVAHTDGQHLLVFASETADGSHTKKNTAYCFIIDTVNFEFIRKITLDAQVEGVINVGGVIYVTYGQNLGYFNGDGITFLRKLNLPTNDATVYKHGLANMEGILLVKENDGVLAYGDLGLGHVFWYLYSDDAGRATQTIYYAGDNKLLVSSSHSTKELGLMDYDGVGGAANFDSNFYSFPSKVWIRKIEIECETLASGSDITFYSLDKNDTATELFSLDFATYGAIDYLEKFVNIKTSLFKLRAAFVAGNTKGIHKITVWYEDAE